jgi:hypothetical protein
MMFLPLDIPLDIRWRLVAEAIGDEDATLAALRQLRRKPFGFQHGRPRRTSAGSNNRP